MSSLRLLVVISCLMYGLWPTSINAAPPASASAPTRCVMKVAHDGSAIVIPVIHRNKTYRFLIDTGSGRTLLDPGAFSHLTGMAGSISIANPKSQIENPGDLRVAQELLIKSPKLYLMDMSPARVALGLKVDGILGCDFLNEYVVHINGDVGQLETSDAIARPVGSCVSFTRDEFRRPIIRAGITDEASEGLQNVFLIDTGFVGVNGITLQRSTFQECVDQGLLVVEGKRSTVQATGTSVERLGTLKRLTIWKTFDHIQVSEKSGHQLNLIGLSYLMQFNLTFDFPNSKLYVEPLKDKLDLSHLKDLSGLGIGREESNIVVKYLEPQSPAAKAGLREGDLLLSINGVPGEQIRLFPLRKSFCVAGQKVSLEVQRGTKKFKLDFQLEDWRRPATANDFE